MDKFDYLTLREDKIVPLIQRFGRELILKRLVDTDLYVLEYVPKYMSEVWKNTVTGEILTEEPEPVSQTFTGICLNTRYRSEDIDGTTIKTGDRRLLALNIPKPETGEIITVSGTDFSVVRADEVAPGDTVLFYRIQVRV